jgi:transcription initiation factor TFIIIB Brf1 subunit/transcription initiation factor TFIIB
MATTTTTTTTTTTDDEKRQIWKLFEDEQKKNGCARRENVDENEEEEEAEEAKEGVEGKEDSAAAAAYYRVKEGLCSACHHLLRINEEGFPTCSSSSCGIIYKDVLDSAPEWKTFANADDRGHGGSDGTRCGNPVNPLLSDSASFGCRILAGSRGSYEAKKLWRYTEWQSMSHRDKSLFNEFQFIGIMAQNAGIPRMFVEDAMRYHKEISAQKMFRGLNRDGIKAASIYIACRINGHPRTAPEIASIFHLDRTSASNGCSMAINILHNIKRNVRAAELHETAAAATNGHRLGHGEGNEKDTGIAAGESMARTKPGVERRELDSINLSISSPSTFIERFCSKLAISLDLTYLCKFVAAKIEKDGLLPDDNTPQSVAAGIIYSVVRMKNLDISKSEIRRVCNVSEVTINKCSKKVDSIRDKVVPLSFFSKPV